MDFEQIAELAYKEKELNEFANLPEKYAYLELKDLYYRYKCGDFSKEQSIKIKNKIKKEYESNISTYKENQRIYKEYNDNRIRNTLYLARLEKSNDKNEIIEMLLKIISNCLSDDTIFERNKSKIDN